MIGEVFCMQREVFFLIFVLMLFIGFLGRLDIVKEVFLGDDLWGVFVQVLVVVESIVVSVNVVSFKIFI